MVGDQLKLLTFSTLIYVGCGEGRFCKDIRREFPEFETLGIDYSSKAIQLDNAMNPALRYEVIDITEEHLDRSRCVEILEHIPPDRIDSFLEAIASANHPKGRLVLTVPHELNRGLCTSPTPEPKFISYANRP